MHEVVPPQCLTVALCEIAIQQGACALDDAFEYQFRMMPIEIDDRIDQGILIFPRLANLRRKLKARASKSAAVSSLGIRLPIDVGPEETVRLKRRWGRLKS